MSMAVRSGSCHWPSSSIRNPAFSASNSSVTSRTCFTSSRDSINMSLLPLSFSVLNPFQHHRRNIRIGLNEYYIDALERIENEIRYQTEFVILPLSRNNFERRTEKPVHILDQYLRELGHRILFEADNRALANVGDLAARDRIRRHQHDRIERPDRMKRLFGFEPRFVDFLKAPV